MTENREIYLAHSEHEGCKDLLKDHLTLVAQRASQYGESSGFAEEAYVTGLLHDLGKYGDLFQKRLRHEEEDIDHWTPGAGVVIQKFRKNGVASAFAILGHHTGIQTTRAQLESGEVVNPAKLTKQHPLGLRLSDPDYARLIARLQDDGIYVPELVPSVCFWPNSVHAATMLDIRMLFSTVVDADFVETEAHFQSTKEDGKRYRSDGLILNVEQALSQLESHLAKLEAESDAGQEIKRIRHDLLSACLMSANQKPGIFTLSAPTGTGKTFSMLAFALKHALIHELRRVIYVIPYLNIIEQNVNEYHKVFSKSFPPGELERFILEDHSLSNARISEGDTLDDENKQYNTALISQNWDAPIIITTSVQFLESLFANRPAACRKLHRIARSVILFDEVQTLPVHLAIPTLATLSRLTERYGCSVVFATATQPAFSHLNESVKKLCVRGWTPSEIVAPGLNLFQRARRVRLIWPDLENKTTWDALALNFQRHEQALCILNLKKHARELFEILSARSDSGLFHLSTNMCPVHRTLVLDEVRKRLQCGQPCRLVSTQCVEAGVDIDFPAVFRALGPLEAIAQAAGRCNRHGLNKEGLVHVFVPDVTGTLYPDGAYSQATGQTESLLRKHGAEDMDINCPELFTEYYHSLYNIIGMNNMNTELINAIKILDFAKVAGLYRVINQDTINVLVPYKKADTDTHVQHLKEEVQESGISRDWIRRARPYTVSIFRPKPDDPVKPFLEPCRLRDKSESDDWFIYLKEEDYDLKLGLKMPEKTACLIA